MSNNSSNSPMLQAFLNQSNISDKKAEEQLNQEKLLQKENERKALLQFSRSQNIKDYITIDSKIKESDINQKPEVHENFKNYDHSLEKVRIKFQAVKNPTESDDNIGSVEEMFNSIFKD